MNVLTEISENRIDPQLKIKIKYLSEENKNLTEDNSHLLEQLTFLKSHLKNIQSEENQTSENKTPTSLENPHISHLTFQLEAQREKIKELQYENFVSRQIVNSIKIIEADLTNFFEGKMGDLKIRIEGLIDKVKELESLKSIPIGNNGDLRYFLITKNVL